MVNFLSMFCPELQKLLKPIYDLTRKSRPFIWGKEQEDLFEDIKCRLIETPVLHMPNTTGRFHLYSDTRKFDTGSAIYQIQNGKLKLIVYASKITRNHEKLFHHRVGTVWISYQYGKFFTFTLKRGDFNSIVYHLFLTHITKSKVEPVTIRIKRLL